ncbi:MAG TPA: hypothetical protein VMV79_05620 [Alphaproteobacteria bacterium]|nr:hypothetical protein [Alphaproteobacteria bacterium]
MMRRLLPCLAVLGLVACGGPNHIAQFWRPISAPNIEMSLDEAQKKLDFDLSQCQCGIYPTNVTQSDLAKFQPDKERLAETSETITPNDKGQCMRKPSLVVAECMRARGWEVTNCSGRMPLAGGGALCAGYLLNN